MKASKTLTSVVAASALVGAIGLAYAQSTTTTTPAMPADQTTQNQGTTVTPSQSTMPATPSATPSTTTTTTTSPDAGMRMERPAQADRN